MPFGQRDKLYNESWGPNPTAVLELQNKPRKDLDGKYHGNTLSDDMFAIKNPNSDRHTQVSYPYPTQPREREDVYSNEPSAGWGSVGPEIPALKKADLTLAESLLNRNPIFGRNDFRDTGVSREKNVTGESLPLTVDKDWGLTDDILEWPEYYTQEQVAWAEALRDKRETERRINELSSEGIRNEQMGYAPERMSSRREAEVDPYLDELINYSALSPATIEQLAKMGVNRPLDYQPYEVQETNASDQLMELINAYKWAMENGYR